MPLPTDFVEGDSRPHVADGHNATNVKVNDLETDQHDPLEAGHGWHGTSPVHDTKIADHVGAANPHPAYLTQAEGDGLYSPIHGHPYEASGAVATHAADADPHGGYQKESEKGTASGYASLGADGLVPQEQLGTGTQDGTKFLRDDGTWQPAAGGSHPDLAAHDTLGLATDTELANHVGAVDPHGGYRKESDPILTADIQDAAVTYAKLQDVSATDRLLGRDTAGAGDVEEIAPAAARTMLDVPATGDVPSNATFNDHSARHEDGGADEISIAGLAGTPVELTTHLNDATAAHAASAISYAGSAGLSAVDVEAALDELDTEKSGTAHTHSSIITVGGVFLDPTAARFIMVWRAPFACTVTNVRGHRKGGVSASVNARRNQTSDFLSVDLTLTSADAWMDGGAVQNTVVAEGDDIEIELASIVGSVTEVTVQVDLTRS